MNNRIRETIDELTDIRSEEGHAAAWGGGGIITILLIVLLLILIF